MEFEKLDFENGIPKEHSTFVVIPTIVNSKEKVKVVINRYMEKITVEELIEKNRLQAVISMPSGVFKPYAGATIPFISNS